MGILGPGGKGRATFFSIALILLAAPLLQSRALAEASGPDFFRVVGVASDDSLNIRADAGASHPKIGEIPANTDGLRNLGCVGGLSFSEWQNASEEERAAAARTRSCRIEYAGVQGWVAGRFLTEGSAPSEASTRALWRIDEVGGFPVEGDAQIGFRADGGLYGSTGCNRFQGRATFRDGQLTIQGPIASTRMACPGERLDAQERDIFAILESGSRVQFDPLRDEMLLTGIKNGKAIRLARVP